MTKPIGKATESMITRMDKIIELVTDGGKTISQLCEVMCLSDASIRRYVGMLEEDGELHIGDWQGSGREATAIYMVGKAKGVIVAKRKTPPKKNPKPVVRNPVSFATDPLLGSLFGSRRAA